MRSDGPNPLEKISAVEVVGAQQALSLQIFGLRWPAGPGLIEYTTLDEALLNDLFDVTEITEGGLVPTIKVSNKSGRMVFLMAGELLVGSKQDRVLNTSMMVPSNTEMPIPVACVEEGRWGYQSRKFQSGKSSSHSCLRMMLSMQTSKHYREQGAPGSDQAAVWAEVRKKMDRMGSSSDSGALKDMFEDCSHKLNQVLQNLSAPDGCHGAAFTINGNIVGVDLFDKPATLGKLWSKLIKSYAVDALEAPNDDSKPLRPEWVTEWINSANSAKQEWFNSSGLGQDVRIEGEMLIGAALVVEQQPVHLELFGKENK